MLGRHLLSTAPSVIIPIPYTHAELDITRHNALEQALTARPDVVINAAAYTAVDDAEQESGRAFAINGTAVGTLGEIAARSGARVVHVSTDYVFAGTSTQPYEEESHTQPVNTYGASKLAGETALRQSGAHSLIVRTQWMFGATGKSFVRTMWERARAGVETKVVNDQTGRPTYARDLAHAVWSLISREARGVVHVANDGIATWFDLAEHIFARDGQRELLRACLTTEYPTAARRPHYSVLSTGRFENLFGQPLPHWRSAVDHCLQQWDKAGQA